MAARHEQPVPFTSTKAQIGTALGQRDMPNGFPLGVEHAHAVEFFQVGFRIAVATPATPEGAVVLDRDGPDQTVGLGAAFDDAVGEVGMFAVHGEGVGDLVPAHDAVVGDVADQQIAAIADPDRPFGPTHAAGEFLHAGIIHEDWLPARASSRLKPVPLIAALVPAPQTTALEPVPQTTAREPVPQKSRRHRQFREQVGRTFAVRGMAGRAAVAIDGLARDHGRVSLRQRFGGLDRLGAVLQVHRNGEQVLVLPVLRRVLHFLGHRPGRNVKTVCAGFQVADDVGFAPRADAVMAVGGDVRRHPVLQVRTAEELIVLVPANQVLRRVARAAVAQAFNQVSAAVPLLGLVRIGLEFALLEVDQVPCDEAGAHVERERQLIGLDLVVHRVDGFEVRKDRQIVLTPHLGVSGEGHGAVQTLAVQAMAFGHGVLEVLEAPATDTGGRVGGDVCARQFAERRVEDDPAGKQRFARDGVARRTVAEGGQVFVHRTVLRVSAHDEAANDVRRLIRRAVPVPLLGIGHHLPRVHALGNLADLAGDVRRHLAVVLREVEGDTQQRTAQRILVGRVERQVVGARCIAARFTADGHGAGVVLDRGFFPFRTPRRGAGRERARVDGRSADRGYPGAAAADETQTGVVEVVVVELVDAHADGTATDKWVEVLVIEEHAHAVGGLVRVVAARGAGVGHRVVRLADAGQQHQAHVFKDEGADHHQLCRLFGEQRRRVSLRGRRVRVFLGARALEGVAAFLDHALDVAGFTGDARQAVELGVERLHLVPVGAPVLQGQLGRQLFAVTFGQVAVQPELFVRRRGQVEVNCGVAPWTAFEADDVQAFVGEFIGDDGPGPAEPDNHDVRGRAAPDSASGCADRCRGGSRSAHRGNRSSSTTPCRGCRHTPGRRRSLPWCCPALAGRTICCRCRPARSRLFPRRSGPCPAARGRGRRNLSGTASGNTLPGRPGPDGSAGAAPVPTDRPASVRACRSAWGRYGRRAPTVERQRRWPPERSRRRQLPGWWLKTSAAGAGSVLWVSLSFWAPAKPRRHRPSRWSVPGLYSAFFITGIAAHTMCSAGGSWQGVTLGLWQASARKAHARQGGAITAHHLLMPISMIDVLRRIAAADLRQPDRIFIKPAPLPRRLLGIVHAICVPLSLAGCCVCRPSVHRVAAEMPDPIPLKDHEKETRLVNKRLIACAVFVAMLSVALVCRMYFLQVTEFAYHSTISENNRVHVLPIPPERGLIFDRNGVILADNRPSFNLTMTRERAGDWHAVIDTLMQILNLPDEDRIIFDKAMKNSPHRDHAFQRHLFLRPGAQAGHRPSARLPDHVRHRPEGLAGHVRGVGRADAVQGMEAHHPTPGLVPGRNGDSRHWPGLHAGHAA
nr:hypothetical protein [Tanacetum cinerariifolium]